MSAGIDPQCRIFATPEQLAEGVADWIVERARDQLHRFALCLSGGEAPKRLYELIGAAPRRDRFPWERTHWFWGDERVVPHDDPRSNFHLAWEALLRHAPIPPENIHAILTERISAAAGAAEYEAVLKRFYGADQLEAGRPLFDLTLLGLGEDGHIASLFPGSPALAETEKWVVPVIGAGDRRPNHSDLPGAREQRRRCISCRRRAQARNARPRACQRCGFACGAIAAGRCLLLVCRPRRGGNVGIQRRVN